tara:strand:- start:236 stop:436 length:201 start_codon:yes stop_codon:yes gene_type:complete
MENCDICGELKPFDQLLTETHAGVDIIVCRDCVAAEQTECEGCTPNEGCAWCEGPSAAVYDGQYQR